MLGTILLDNFIRQNCKQNLR